MKLSSNLIIGIICLFMFFGFFLFQEQVQNENNELFTVSDTLIFQSSYFDCMERNEFNNSDHG